MDVGRRAVSQLKIDACEEIVHITRQFCAEVAKRRVGHHVKVIKNDLITGLFVVLAAQSKPVLSNFPGKFLGGCDVIERLRPSRETKRRRRDERYLWLEFQKRGARIDHLGRIGIMLRFIQTTAKAPTLDAQLDRSQQSLCSCPTQDGHPDTFRMGWITLFEQSFTPTSQLQKPVAVAGQPGFFIELPPTPRFIARIFGRISRPRLTRCVHLKTTAHVLWGLAICLP